jgi:hypothetical protein
MSQSGYTPIITYNSSTTGHVPTTGGGAITTGELAVNITDGILFVGTGTNTYNTLVASKGTTSITTLGTVTTGTWNATTIAVGYGGTGVTTTPTNGQLLIGNGTNYTVASLGSGTGISTTTGSGTLTINNTGVTSAVAGTGVTVSASTGAVTFSIGQAVGTSASAQFGSFGVGTAASGTTGEIRATNNVTAYYSSDIKFKTNVQEIQDPLGIVTTIGSKTFDWTDEYLADHGGEDEYFQPKQSFGVIAQDVQKVFPQAVRTRTDGSLAVDYEKLAILSFGAIGQLLKRVEALEAK